MPPSFSSPWGDSSTTPQRRIQSDVPTSVVGYLQSLSPGPGIIQNIIQSTFYALEHDCRNAGLTGWTTESHAALVGFIRNRTSPRAAATVSDGHVTRTTADIRAAYEAVADKSSDVLQNAPRGRRQRGVVGIKGNNKTTKSKKLQTKA